ncbi:hypothetical protein [Streptomyces mirabilis]
MAAALTPPGARTVIEDSPEAITAFLRPRPAHELPGVGARTAATLTDHGLHTVGDHGLHTVGDVADVPAVPSRDRGGRLWFVSGTGDGTLISGGWNSMTALTRHGDLNGDGTEDLIARDSSGELWFYRATAKASSAPVRPWAAAGSP